MNETPYYTGGADPGASEARRIARRLDKQHPGRYDYIFSAAAFLIRDGQPPTDSRVLEEARRRKRHADGAYKLALENIRARRAENEKAA